MSKRLIISILILAIFLILCWLFLHSRKVTQSPTVAQSNQLQVTTSFYPLYFFAREIGGEKANVTNITPAGTEPHDYEPSPEDLFALENSGLIIINGSGLEAWSDNIKQNIDPNKTKLIVVSQSLATGQALENGKTVSDPHVWLSPHLAEQMVERILSAYLQIDPDNASYYRANASNLTTKLDSLDQEYKRGLMSCANKNLVTGHAAFGYLSRDYGLTQVPITGISPDQEPSPSQLAEITRTVINDNVKYIFSETLVSPKLSSTLAEEVGAQVLVLDPLEGLTKEEEVQGQNYYTIMESNLKNLEIGLECNQ